MKTMKNKMNLNLLIAGLMGVLLLAAGCNKENPVKKSFIEPPFEKLDPKMNVFTVDNQSPDTLSLESGTRIFIPVNAFADSSGIPVRGKVKVKYREFHDALDIFLAGIPMEFSSRGERKHLQTAGMFEIQADKNGTALQMTKDKSVKVEMGSRTAGNEYNFFGFNEDDGSWDFMGYPESRENPEYEKIKEKVANLEDTRKMPLDPSHFIFDYRGALDVYRYKLKRDAETKEIKTRVQKYGLDWLNVDNRNMVNFHGNKYVASFMVWKKLAGGPFPGWLRTKNYFSTRMKKLYGNVYRLKIEHRDGMNYSGKIKCIMPLRSLLAFSPEYWENNYEEALQKARKEEERLRTEAKVFRTFEVNQLGVYNFDCLYKQQNPVQVKANFTVDGISNNETYQLNQIFCLPGNNRTVIKLTPHNWEKVWLDEADENFRFITVLPGNELGMFPLEKYRALNFDSLRKAENPEVNFTLEPVGKKIKSRKQLEELLGFD